MSSVLHEEPDIGNRARPRRRRALLLVAYAAFLVLVLELGSFAALRLAGGYSGERLRNLQSALATEEGLREEDVPDAARGPVHLRGETIHPYLGYVPRRMPPIPNGVHLNQAAFYAADSPVFSSRRDTIVVGITGGSLAGYFAIEGGETLARELAAHPSFAGKRIRLAGLAFGGFKQPQQLMALHYVLALGGRLDVLINLDGFNEIALHESENAAQGVSTAYPRSWFFRVYSEHVLGPVLGELAYLRRGRARAALHAFESPLRRSWTYRLIWKLRDRQYKRSMRRIEDFLRAYEPGRELALTGPRSQAESPQERLDELVSLWRNSSLQLERSCRANGIAYFHFLQPNQYVPGSKPLSDEERRTAVVDDHPYGKWVPAGYQRLVPAGAELARSGVMFRDLTGVFEGVDETLYVDDCCHVNKLGYELIARALARFILANSR